jgi:phage terminase large subunit GpA-like protein
LTVSEWADKYRILEPKISAFPGPWRTDRTPYLREIMDAFNDPEIEEIVFIKPTQVGGTETLNNVLGFIIDQDQSPTLVVYPTIDLAEYTSVNRVQAMIDSSPALREKWDVRASNRLELQFSGMYLILAGANSPASLSARPCRFVLMDELDKYPSFAGIEADPRYLAKERTKFFSFNKKILKASTPTVETGPIYQEWLDCDIRKEYFVPCPHCGTFQMFLFKQIKWPEELSNDPSKVRDAAWYECEHCQEKIFDVHKQSMVRSGVWRAINESETRARKVGYHLNSIASPSVTFGDVAAEFLRSKDYPERMRNFVNSWLGEVWRNKQIHAQADALKTHISSNDRATIPSDMQMLIASVDVQLDYFWWEVRGFGEFFSSSLVDYGRAETWTELEEILERRWPSKTGDRQIRLMAIDSGFRTDEVYDFCTAHPKICIPVKGSSTDMRSPYTVSTIDKESKNKYGGLRLYMINTDYYKDLIHGRLAKEPGQRGAWMFFKDCPAEYFDHLVAEAKIIKRDRKTGKITEEWQKLGHAPNHLLDTCVYSTAAAEICGVRYLAKNDHAAAPPSATPAQGGYVPKRDWFAK